LVTIFSLVAVAFGWGMFARLDSAVVTQGVLFAESERKSIESLEGGILESLRVQPGDRVTKGQILAVLDATQIREARTQLEVDRQSLTYEIWRLQAEAAGLQNLDPASAPIAATDPLRHESMAMAQRRLFVARLRSHQGVLDGLSRQIEGLKAQIAAASSQQHAAERQIALWQEERAQTAALVEKGATARQKLLDMDRTLAALEGARDENSNLVRAAEEEIAQSGIEADTQTQVRISEIETRMADALRQTEGLNSRIRAADDVLERHNMRAPQDGVIVNISTVTPGAVVGSGVPLMELIPDGDRLMILARLSPDAIDTMHPGRHATIHLTAFGRAVAPVVDGAISYVSADLLQDERDGTPYFEARISIDPDSLAKLSNVTLVSGMPVEVAIQIGERRAGAYFLEPILRHMRGAFNEE